MKSQLIRVKNLPKLEEKGRAITLKPVFALVLLMAFGFYTLWWKPYLATASMFMILISVFALTFLPDRKLVEFYSQYMVLYNQRDRSQCMLVYWDEIVSWQYEWHTTNDLLVLNLVDGTSQQIEMYSKYKVVKFMNIYVPDKQIKSTRMKES